MQFDLDIATEIEVSTKRQRVGGKKGGTTKTAKKRSLKEGVFSAAGNTDLASVSPKRQKVTGKENFDGTTKTAKKRSLRKQEKKAVADHISRTDSITLIASVLQQVDGEHHIHAFPERTEVWEKLKISDLLPVICKCYKQMYVALYKEFSVGSDKHAKFQLKWYQECSFMLADINIDNEHHHCLSPVINRWSDFRNAHCKGNWYHINAVMISIQGAVFKQLAKLVAQEIPTYNSSTTESIAEAEPEDVHYRFGGAAIAEMLLQVDPHLPLSQEEGSSSRNYCVKGHGMH